MKKTIFMIASLLLSFSVFAELQGDMKAFTIKSNDGDVERVIAKEVNNGDIIEYEITYTNTSEETLTKVSIKGKIHESTDFIYNSETRNPKPVYSIDSGKTWSYKPKIKSIDKNGEIIVSDASIDSYTDIKWDIEEFKGNSVKTFIYRVKVKE